MRNYKNIEAYKLADELVIEIYKFTKLFPVEEKFSLVSQLRRAAISSAVNIVEGAGRRTLKDYISFLYISRGSVSEVEYLLSLSFRFRYIEEENYKQVDILIRRLAKCLMNLILAIQNDKIQHLDT